MISKRLEKEKAGVRGNLLNKGVFCYFMTCFKVDYKEKEKELYIKANRSLKES